MKKNSTVGSFQTSFLDVLFGALGAFVLMFMLLYISSAAPTRPLAPVSRFVIWSIKSENLPKLSSVTLYRFEDAPNASPNGESTQERDRTASPLLKDVKSEDDSFKRTAILGIFSSERSDDELKLTLEIPNDDLWEDNLTLELEFSETFRSPVEATVEATPGGLANGGVDNHFSDSAIGKSRLRIETIVELKDALQEEGGGKLPVLTESKFEMLESSQ